MAEAKRLRALEDENRKLKMLLAESMLDQAVLKKASDKRMGGSAAKLEAVGHLRNVLQMSERGSSTLAAADRITIRYY